VPDLIVELCEVVARGPEVIKALIEDSEIAVSVLKLADRSVQDVEDEFSTVAETYHLIRVSTNPLFLIYPHLRPLF